MGLTVQLLPVSAVVLAGHRIRVAMAGHDAPCFTRYGPAEETFTLRLGDGSHLDLPVLSSRRIANAPFESEYRTGR
jgi:uncharacterized protein